MGPRGSAERHCGHSEHQRCAAAAPHLPGGGLAATRLWRHSGRARRGRGHTERLLPELEVVPG
eukprot:NODE_10683_length_299_cov_97.790984.p4 GENE.NODE_10683_length_299_cov_97.790984~~NODE_10683_length_299_cov_97.790984.p4  ORF type:complete len:63 (+),score=5.68 NODE_10683_length_299_cov_97.790984:3-191(+)